MYYYWCAPTLTYQVSRTNINLLLDGGSFILQVTEHVTIAFRSLSLDRIPENSESPAVAGTWTPHSNGRYILRLYVFDLPNCRTKS